jgi:hypothetical protein
VIRAARDEVLKPDPEAVDRLCVALHHFTCARIIRTLNRMNANAAMNATKKQKSRSLPGSTTDC